MIECDSFSELKSDSNEKYVEGVVCNENDIGENEMKNFNLGDSEILLVKQNGQINAMGPYCSHYGVRLSLGVLGKGRVRCPWHGACFDIKTGDIEDFPGEDSMPIYSVSIIDGQVKVRAKKSELKSSKRTKAMAKKSCCREEKTFVIIGAGPSGGICAETIRQNCFTGRLLMVGKENALPYDRPEISRSLEKTIDQLYNRPQKFYDDYNIETKLGVSVTSLNCAEKQITLSDGETVTYDKVYIATGSSPRKLSFPGSNLSNIFTLRTFEDAQNIVSKLTSDTHVVVLGVSFIGMEAAAFCVDKGAKVTIVGRDDVPLKNVFGITVGRRIINFFEEKGTEFRMNSGIVACRGTDKIESVELVDGSLLKADVLIMGVGSILNTEFLKLSGLTINTNGSIDTNIHLETNIPDVYVGGDIANAPVFSNGNQLSTIGHYPLAQYHGRIAGLNMMGKREKLNHVPFFWTRFFGKPFRYCGHGIPASEHIEGSLEDLKFVVFYFDDEGKVIAVLSVLRDPVVAQFAELLSQGKSLTKLQLMEDPFGWAKLLNEEM